ncbi:MAG: hypothetical protein ACXW2P_13365 [Thermoanaerobaculia bacterium]
MIVPLPFSRAIYLYGDPIVVPRRGDVEEWRARVERVLNELAATAEEQFDLLWKEASR